MATQFDESEVLFSEDDPNYRATLIDTGIPPPRLYELARGNANPRFNNRRQHQNQQHQHHSQQYQHQHHNQQHHSQQHQHHSQQNQHQYQDQHHPYQSQQMRQTGVSNNNMRDSVDQRRPTSTDARKHSYRVDIRHRGPEFISDLSSPNWLRMASDRDDPRGRQANSRLCDIALVQEIDKLKGALSNLLPPDAFETLCYQTNIHAGLLHNTSFVGASAVALGHIDFLSSAVSMYLDHGRSAAPLLFVDLGSEQGGFSEYILWKAAGKPEPTTDDAESLAHGWYFDPHAYGSQGAGLPINEMHAQCDASRRLTVVSQTDVSRTGITSEANIDAFVRQVQGELPEKRKQAAGIDLVVGESCYRQVDLAMDHEKGQYAFTLAQIIITLQLLRSGGSFVFKIFDVTTPPTAEMLFILGACFESMDIVRSPVARPTSSERYVVCKALKGDARWAALHMRTALAKINSGHFKLSHILSWTRVMEESVFVGSLKTANREIAQIQLGALRTISEIASTGRQVADRSVEQRNIATRCLEEWGLLQSTK